MKVIVGWVDTKKFTPVTDEQKSIIREKLGIPKKQTVGVAVSRLVEFKNIPAVLEIAKNIVANPNNMFILPIPQSTINVNQNVIQNEGY